MLSPTEKLAITEELLDIASFQFVRRLKEKNPSISEADIEIELVNWYRTRPGAELGDGPGVPADLKKYL